ncbi:xanthine dehydrogenase family protein molybdopterin-binding subunit [Gymnodinialimonas ceratoperidinii]|uniref:Xanthine dehydrogenase family protein molybdopterin-binding subunit n=1 Tax=Gymnodinialimonas ceratoperidinii TaxID=2856823 RepID=A0A8F6TW48_9RHOB|nr:xanthine dehydrogenase family protein molybdopterin-binding subunit [Gymnodinialimonas ceratoperidinii]QXT38999.1 xanthine dehydrogenase family protein molybdopterin-binding subunit [Gymnodinialimonas ceratoperidinii]
MFDRPASLIGTSPVDRRAALRLRGEGLYVGDVALTNPLHLSFARATEPRGDLASIDTADALEVPGVVAVHVGEDVAGLGALSVNPVLTMRKAANYPILAHERVSGLGQPVAAVLAETPHAALDGAEALWVDIEPSKAPADDTVAERTWRTGDPEAAFAQAAHVVEVEVRHPRLAPSSLEPRAIAVEWAEEGLTIWLSSQTPHRARLELAKILDVEVETLRVIAPDVGGAFGMKASLYPEEVFAVWAALKHRRSVRWCATRSEEFLSATQGRGLATAGRLAVSTEGDFLALDARVTAPVGPWLANSALIPAWNAARVLPCGYEIESVDIETRAVHDARAPMSIYRGAGRPEAACLMERLVDEAARATGLDPIAIRARNLAAPGALPLRTATGNLLDSGDYPQVLSKCAAAAGYDALRAERDRKRAEGQLSGIGVAFYLEPSGEGFETARVTWTEAGVTVASGSSSQGQGRETGYAQIAAELLDVPMEAVAVLQGDTGSCPEGIGAVASRSTAIGGSAVFVACERLRARRLAGEPLPLEEDVRYENEGQAWGYGVYIVALDIARDTGAIEITQATCLDDAGRILNPAFVEGQIRGGFAQGFGEAMMEAVHYDDDGQLLTGSLMDYALPRAADMPNLDINTTHHPSPFNALGAKGVGEAGTIGAPAALLNAALDALSPIGVTDLDMPLTPCKIWSAIRDAEGKNT